MLEAAAVVDAPMFYTHEPFKENAAPQKIKSIRFGLMSAQEVVRNSEFQVFERNLYEMPQRQPLANGVLDRCAREFV